MLWKLILALAMIATPTVAQNLVQPSAFQVPEGLEVTVWSTSPMFFNPTNIDFDAHGRCWVTEAANYRNFRNKGFKKQDKAGDRVVVLTDTNGDGKADQSHVFVQDKDLVAPLGIGVIGNRVFVATAPHMILYTDVNGDAKFDPAVDKKEIWLTGFGGHDHDHSLHALHAGPDGLFYFNVGNAGPHFVKDKSGWMFRSGSVYNGGAPQKKKNTPGHKSDDGRQWPGGVAFHINPDGTKMTPIGFNFRNSYEETVSSFGDVFQNDNDDPPACRTTWLMKYGNLGFFSEDGSRHWKADKRPGQSTAIAEWRQEDPGTIPAGDVYGNGAPTGIVLYENGALGPKHPGLLLSCESARRVVYGYYPKPTAAGFKLERFDFFKPGSDPKASWFRPADVAVGTDGAVYIADWFDPGVGGHRMRDPESAGTIYRVAPKGYKPSVAKLDLKTIGGQIQALQSPAHNVRHLGFEKLAAAGSQAEAALKAMWADQNLNRFVRARAVWLLAKIKGGQFVSTLLSDPDPQVRVLAFRALQRAGHDPLPLAQKVVANDAIGVKREALLMLRDVKFEQKKDLLVQLAGDYDGADRWYLEALGTAAENHEAELYALLHKKYGDADPLKWDARFAGFAWRLHPPSAIDDLLKRAMHAGLPIASRKAAMDAIAFIPDKAAAVAMAKISNEGPEDLQANATWWGHNRKNNDWKAFDISSLFPKPPPTGGGKSNKGSGAKGPKIKVSGKPLFESKVLGSKDVVKIDVDITDMATLFLVIDDGGNGINSDWGNWGDPMLHGPTGEVPLTSVPWLAANSGWKSVQRNKNVEGKKLTLHGTKVKGGIGAHANSVIQYNLAGKGYKRFTATVGQEASKGGGSIRFRVVGQKAKSVGPLPGAKQLAAMKGDVKKGKALFFGRGTCFACHKIGEQGGDIGPVLTGVGTKFPKQVILEGILEPSKAIALGFETWSIQTSAGKTLTGFLVADGDPVILKDAAGQSHTVAKSKVAKRTQSKVSIMPSAKQLNLTAEQLADLAAYLASVK